MKRIEKELKQFDYNDCGLRMTLGVLVVVCLCAFLIVIATFTELSFSSQKLPVEAMFHPIRFLTQTDNPWLFLFGYQYIPQIPVILFIAALLGRRFGTLAVVMYIILGLSGFPIFAMGGGIHYLLDYSFGYILSYIPTVVVAGTMLGNKITLKNAIKASFFGVLMIHFVGVLYTTIVIICKHDSFELFMDMVAVQSGIKMIYDFIVSVFAIILAKPIKKFLWLAMG